eukprot:GILI01000842.1.p1 GENE.GILI01000842.1~~GILI01000842.1.p1  ORF type:complete len:528 (+),score=121.21 GILI01000842.1:104-1585(+)
MSAYPEGTQPTLPQVASAQQQYYTAGFYAPSNAYTQGYTHTYQPQVVHQPQITPWAPYMRKPVGQSSAQAVPIALQPLAPVSTSSAPPTSTNSSTKRHNPYATTSENSSAVTSPALGYTAAGQNPHPLTFESRMPSNSYHQPAQQREAQPRPQQPQGPRQVTVDEVRSQQGTFLELAHTANGSAFLQAAIRGTQTDTQQCIDLISAELLPHLGDLLLDSHGCYIIKTLMERMPVAQLQEVLVKQIAPDESLVYSLCTHSLHTRRVVQFLLDTVDCTFLIDTITARCNEIATTQQGCIVVQRAMDVAKEAQRKALFDTIQSQFNSFCYDPFANYVLQHMFAVGNPSEIGQGVWPHIKGNVINLSCNKFASNVVEKCLSNLPTELQHELLQEMYDVTEERLLGMLQDSFGNYIIQTSIALAPQRDIPFMRTKLQAVLDRTPYGHKIESRLERRRKVTKGDASHSHQGPSQKPSHKGRGGRPIAPVAPVAEGEEPW